MKKILILVGCSGAGKSTFAKEIQTQDPSFKRINKDDLRLMIDNGVWSRENEAWVQKQAEAMLTKALKDGYNVIWDNTNLKSDMRKRVHKIAEQVGDVLVKEIYFNVALEECLRRNALRTGLAKVPEEVILKMHSQFKNLNKKETSTVYPKHNENKNGADVNVERYLHLKNPHLPAAIICDLDGTIALLNGRNPYDASSCGNDLLNFPLYDILTQFSDIQLIFLSGREDKFRLQTDQWLAEHFSFTDFKLFMRATGDSRSDDIIKEEIYHKEIEPNYCIRYVFDDRLKVRRMWWRLGLPLFSLGDPDANF